MTRVEHRGSLGDRSLPGRLIGRARLSALLLGGLCLVLGLLPTRAADTVEAARCKLLLACFRYIDWPTTGSDDGPWILGVLGTPPFGKSESKQVAAMRKQGRPVVIRICDSPEEARECHVVFVGIPDRRRVAALLEILRDSTVWTVGEMDGFTKLGGIMNFTLGGERNFEYSKAAYFRWRERSKTEADPDFLSSLGTPVGD